MDVCLAHCQSIQIKIRLRFLQPCPIQSLILISVAILIGSFISLVRAAEPAGFKTEPTFVPENFLVKHITSNKALLDPGFLFIAPLQGPWGYGPQIYSIYGDLVWYGNSTASFRVQDFHVCDFLGEFGNHLCWHEAESRKGHAPIGRKVVFDHTYSQVGQNYTLGGNGSSPNTHEFRMLPGGRSFLQTIYQPRQLDLTAYTGPKDGWVFDGCFQEIGTATGQTMFQWCSLSVLPIWETRLFIDGPGQVNTSSSLAGSGTYEDPWDFIHLNSLDKNEEGDYIASSRYFDQIFKVAGSENVHGLPAGELIWRIGGKPDQSDKRWTFSRQHSARYLQTNTSGDTIALLDNAWEGFTTPTANRSSGKIIRVDNSTSEIRVQLLEDYPFPQERLTKAQGGIQILNNGNIIIGWGVRPQISEFSRRGQLLYHVKFQQYSYRAFKHRWIGKPHWKPKVLSYSLHCNTAPLHAYVSWNGATEVAHWKFYIAASSNGPWKFAAKVPKRAAFETHAQLLNIGDRKSTSRDFPRYVLVEALDRENGILGNATATTFVPSSHTRSKHGCNHEACETPITFEYQPTLSIARDVCGVSTALIASLAAIFCLMVEAFNIIHLRLLSYNSGIRLPP